MGIESIIAAPFSFNYRFLPLVRAQQLERKAAESNNGLSSNEQQFLGSYTASLQRLKDVGADPRVWKKVTRGWFDSWSSSKRLSRASRRSMPTRPRQRFSVARQSSSQERIKTRTNSREAMVLKTLSAARRQLPLRTHFTCFQLPLLPTSPRHCSVRQKSLAKSLSSGMLGMAYKNVPVMPLAR